MVETAGEAERVATETIGETERVEALDIMAGDVC
jgi:hypothetical protein